MQLRELALGHCSLSFFVNEAHHLGAAGPDANVAWKLRRPKGGSGQVLCLDVLRDIPRGGELLTVYNPLLTRAR